MNDFYSSEDKKNQIIIDRLEAENKGAEQNIVELFESVIKCEITKKNQAKIFRLALKQELSEFTVNILKIKTS